MSEPNPFDVVYLPLARLSASPTQPRKIFEIDALVSLSDNIKEIGVTTPIRVRPLPGLFAEDPSAQLYEIIYGERRCRASTLAGLETVPGIVCDWDDRQVIESQLTENLQRQDLDPLEESESYHQALAQVDDTGAKLYTVESLAKRLGWETRYIRERMSLRDLPETARKALLAGTIGTTHGRLIARIPTETAREEAAERIIRPDFQKSPLTTRETEDLLRRDYMRELRRAPFDQNDASLVPHMGACTTCKFRTGNNPALYGDVQRGDVCTFPECYRQKVEAIWSRATTEAKAAGKIILTADQSEHLWNDEGKLEWNSDWVRLGDQPSSDLVHSTTQRLPTWKTLLDKSPAKVQVYVARTPRGAVHELALRKDALTAALLTRPELFLTPKGQAAPAPLAAAPPPPAAETSAKPLPSTQPQLPAAQSNAYAETERLKAERLKTRIDVAVLHEVVGEIAAGIGEDAEGAPAGSWPSYAYWGCLLPLAIANAGKEGCAFVANCRGIDPIIFQETPVDAASMLKDDISMVEMPALVAQFLLGPYLRFQGAENNPLLIPFLEAYEIDVPAIRAEVESKHQPKKEKKEKAKP